MTTPVQIKPLSTEDPRTLDDKERDLEAILRPLGRVLVGYSGGVDSAMLVVAAHRVLGDGVTAVTAESESYARGELERARQILAPWGIRHVVVHTRELDNPEYASNPVNRCFFCKQELFTRMREVAAELGADTIIYGQNADDVGDFRPGADAARQSGARAPLQEAGLTKQDVRELARRWGVSVWNRPATACLSSRFPYGTPVTAEGLSMVDRAEEHVRGLGYEQLRVRHHSDLARIELPGAQLAGLLADHQRRAGLAAALAAIGYRRVTLDLRGFRSGSMNEVLQQGPAGQAQVEKQATAAAAGLGLGQGIAEKHDQVLRLALPEAGVARLADDATRLDLLGQLEGLGARYVALDLATIE
ncbi:MAG: ATP-dependent sacrificial sulfur transferase LarE [Gemmatimonadota bacterium]